MDPKLLKYYEELKAAGLTSEQEQKIVEELRAEGSHELAEESVTKGGSGIEFLPYGPDGFYHYHDLRHLQGITRPVSAFTTYIRSIDELLENGAKLDENWEPCIYREAIKKISIEKKR